MTQDMKELEELQPATSSVVVGGETVEIKPFMFVQLLQALKYMANMIEDLNPYQDKEVQTFRLIASHPEEVLGLLMLATGKPREWFNTIDSKAGVALALETYKVNSDFFIREVQPLLDKANLSPFGLQSDQKKESWPQQETES